MKRMLFQRFHILLPLCAGCWLATTAASAAPALCRVYIGTYTGGKSEGIYAFELDPESGKPGTPFLAAPTESPSFLAIHPGGRWLYAVNEIGQYKGEPWGTVSAFSIDGASGKLSFINRSLSGGASPCYLVVDRTGRWVLVANYSSGSIAVLPIEDGGRLGSPTQVFTHHGSGADPGRQKGPHAHSINLDAQNRFAVAADLGIDRLLIYRFLPDLGTLVPTGLLTEPPAPGAALRPGSGPRHFAFHPGGRFAYVINELSCTVTAFAYDPGAGSLKELQTASTLPGEVQRGFSTAEVQVHPSGKFLYGSNRGHDSIAVFAIDPEKGTLSPVEHQPTGGRTPRNFGIDPAGGLLLAANQDSGSIVLFRIDAATGRLTATGEAVAVPSPVCVKFLKIAN